MSLRISFPLLAEFDRYFEGQVFEEDFAASFEEDEELEVGETPEISSSSLKESIESNAALIRLKYDSVDSSGELLEDGSLGVAANAASDSSDELLDESRPKVLGEKLREVESIFEDKIVKLLDESVDEPSKVSTEDVVDEDSASAEEGMESYPDSELRLYRSGE